MTSTNKHSKPTVAQKGSWLRRNLAPLTIFLLITAITVGIFLFAQRYPDKFTEFESYGYLGAFLLSLVANATILLPFPGFLMLFALGAAFNPVFIGLTAGIGGAIGEMTAYLLGYTGRAVVENTRFYNQAVRWLDRWGVLTVFVFALTPLPFDVLGVAAGLLRFPFWKFFIACWLGKTVLCVSLALAGAWGWEAFITGGYTSPVSVALLAALGALILLVLALVIENWTWKQGR